MYDADLSTTLAPTQSHRKFAQADHHLVIAPFVDKVYPIVYLDCIIVKIQDDPRVLNKSIYLALGVNMDGRKDLPGLWMSYNKSTNSDFPCSPSAISGVISADTNPNSLVNCSGSSFTFSCNGNAFCGLISRATL